MTDIRATSFVLVGVILTVMVGGAFYAVAYKGGGPPADASLSLSDLTTEQEASKYQANGEVIRFAIAAVLSPRSTLENHQPLASYLSQHLGRRVQIVLGKSYAEINALVRSGDAALALVCSGAFVVGRRDFGMQPLVVPVVNGKATYQSYLIVPSTSPVRRWEDLRESTFAFTDPLSNSGRLVPVYVLSQMDETPDSFFRDYVFTYSHDKSVQAVADGMVDGAAVDSLVYDFMVERDASIGARTRVIWKSPPFGINPVVVHPNLDPVLRGQLESILLGMSNNLEGQTILEGLGIDYFSKPHDTKAYDTIETMLDATANR